MTNAPVDKFGFANVNFCSLKHDPKTLQLGLLTRENFTLSKANLREEKLALNSRMFSLSIVCLRI